MHFPDIQKLLSRGKNLLVIAGFIFLVTTLNTGCSPKFGDAQKLFDQGYFGQSAIVFEQVARNAKDKKEREKANMMAAEAYRLNNKYLKAQKLYEKVLKTDPNNSQALLMRANMLKKMEDYRGALSAYESYLEKVPGDSQAIQKMLGCEMALSWTPDSSLFRVQEFKLANTRANDWAPMVASRKDDVVFFASDREGGTSKRVYGGTLEKWSDMWYIEGQKTKKKRGDTSASAGQMKWGKAMFSKSASTKYNEGGITFNRRFSEMYMTQCGGEDGKSEKCAIYQYKKTGPDWQMGDVLEICKQDTGHSYGHPALGDDDKILFFSSDRDGGFGGFDIWAVTYSRRSRSWGNPVNLGPQINSPGNEYFPYFNEHDKRLYFSSDYWPGLGGLDMFSAAQTEEINKWVDMENLREPLNSGGDDFAITFLNNTAKAGYFTSNRGDRRNDDNIYSFDVLPLVITLRGVVTDCNTKLPLKGATVVITNDKDTSTMVLKTNENGEYMAQLKPKTNYEIVAKNPQLYYFDIPSVQRTTHGIRFSTELVQDFCLVNPLDQIISLPIFYDLDSARIRPDAARILDTFAQEVMIRYPRLIAELGSHTDCRASVDYNTRLAQRRADSARRYLMRRWNIDSSRIIAVGFGEKELINDCKCEGAEKVGFTPYIAGKTRKLVITKDKKGNVISSVYDTYKASEIVPIDGKPFVPCDEFQHQQNRRTTVRFEFEDKKSRVKVNQDVDVNNTNVGVKDSIKVVAAKDSTAAAQPAKPVLDLTFAVKLPLSGPKEERTIPIMMFGAEPTMFIIDKKGKVNTVTPELAAEWYKKKLLTKKDFIEGDKFKVGKIKLPSNKFTVENMEIGDYPITGVQFKIDEKSNAPRITDKTITKYFTSDSYETDKELVLIPKKVSREFKIKRVGQPVKPAKPAKPAKKPAANAKEKNEK